MTNHFYGVFIGVNENLKGRNPAFPAVCREGRPGYMQGYIVERAGSQLYDPDDEAAKRLKNILSGEVHDA